MQNIADLIKIRELPRASPKPSKRDRRNLIIKELEVLTGAKDLWKYLTFPIYIKTEWLEEWKQGIILKHGGRKEKSDYLFELLKQSRKKCL